MRLRTRRYLAVAALLAAAPAAATAQKKAAQARPEVPAPRPNLTLACERLLPESLRARWAQGGTVQATYSQADQMNCELALPGKMPLSASYTCRGGPFDARYWTEHKRKLPKTSAAQDVRVGMGGIYWTASAAHTVSFTDAETGCLVSVTMFGGDKARAVAFAKDVEKALTLESAQ